MIGFVESLHWWIFAKSINWSILDKRIRLWRLSAGMENFVPKTRRVMAAPVCLGWRACARNNDISCRSVALGLAAMLLEARMAEARLAMNRAHSKSPGTQGGTRHCQCVPVPVYVPGTVRHRHQSRPGRRPSTTALAPFSGQGTFFAWRLNFGWIWGKPPFSWTVQKVPRRWPQRPSSWLRGRCEPKWILETPVKRDRFSWILRFPWDSLAMATFKSAFAQECLEETRATHTSTDSISNAMLPRERHKLYKSQVK